MKRRSRSRVLHLAFLLPYFAFCCCGKQHGQGFVSSSSSQFIMKGSQTGAQGRNWQAELKQRPQTNLLTGLLLTQCARVSSRPRTTSYRTAALELLSCCSSLGWAPPPLVLSLTQHRIPRCTFKTKPLVKFLSFLSHPVLIYPKWTLTPVA